MSGDFIHREALFSETPPEIMRISLKISSQA
jgi:hypothetical protein